MPNTERRWATRLPPRPKVETFRSCGTPWRAFAHFHEALDTGGDLAHLQIAAAAHPGGDLGRDAARPAFIGIETDDAERIGILAGWKNPLCAHARNCSGAWLAQLAP